MRGRRRGEETSIVKTRSAPVPVFINFVSEARGGVMFRSLPLHCSPYLHCKYEWQSEQHAAPYVAVNTGDRLHTLQKRVRTCSSTPTDHVTPWIGENQEVETLWPRSVGWPGVSSPAQVFSTTPKGKRHTTPPSLTHLTPRANTDA